MGHRLVEDIARRRITEIVREDSSGYESDQASHGLHQGASESPFAFQETVNGTMEDIDTWDRDTNSVGEDAELSDAPEFMKRVNAECRKDPATRLLISQCETLRKWNSADYE